MSHTWQQYKLRFRPKNPMFLNFTGIYFVSFFFEHPVVGSLVLCHSAVSQKSCHVSYFFNHFTLHGQWPAEELDFDSAPVTDNLINCYFYNILHCHHHKIVHTNTIILSDFLANCFNFQNLVRSGS